jgi:DNA-binding MarR family transcriptional regulator
MDNGSQGSPVPIRNFAAGGLNQRNCTLTASLRPHKNGNAKRLPAGDVSCEKLWIALRRAYHSIVDFLESGVTAKGVAVSDFIVLEVLLHNDALNAAEIAQKTRLSGASVEITLARLMEQNLIGLRHRRGSQQDKHALTLTDSGRGSIDWIYEEHARDIGTIFNILSKQQQRELYQSLRRVGHSAAGRRAVPAANQKGGLTPWQFRRAVEYIRQHAAGHVTIKEIAASIELSDSHFRRAFKIATGVFSTQMAARCAHRRSTEAPKRGCPSTVGNCTCDWVWRSKPFFANVSKSHWCFPTSVAAGS